MVWLAAEIQINSHFRGSIVANDAGYGYIATSAMAHGSMSVRVSVYGCKIQGEVAFYDHG